MASVSLLALCVATGLWGRQNAFVNFSMTFFWIVFVLGVPYAVALVGDGQAIDLVLTDVSLADGSGVEVARAANARGIPVLFVTGQCPSEAEALATGCLAKPYAARDLLAAIGVIEANLAGRKPRRLPGGFRLFDRATTD